MGDYTMSHKYGLETLSCLGPKMWEVIPCHISMG